MTSENEDFDIFFDEYSKSLTSDINTISILFKKFEVYLNSAIFSHNN